MEKLKRLDRKIARFLYRDKPLSMSTLDKRLEKNPNDVKTLHLRCEMHMKQRNYLAVIADATKAIELNPQNHIAYYCRALAYQYHDKRLDDALLDLNQSIALCDNYANAYFHRALIYGIKGDKERAFADFSKTLKLDPANIDARYIRSGILLHDDKFEEAIRDAEKVKSLAPKQTKGYKVRGEIYERMGDFVAALTEYNKVVALEPENPENYFLRAKALLKNDQQKESLVELTMAISLAPTEFKYLFRYYEKRARIYLLIKDYTHALEDIRELTKIKPQDPGYWNLLCWWSSLEGDLKEAVYAGNRAVEIEESNTSYRDSRGIAYGLSGDFEKAIDDLKFFLDNFDSEKFPSVNLEGRKEWVASMEQGKNPFDEDIIQALRNE